MTRTTVSGIRPDKTGTGEWIDINSHVGRLMSTIMAGGRPFSIDADPAGMTIVTPLPPPVAGPDTEAAGGNDSKTGTDPKKRTRHQDIDHPRGIRARRPRGRTHPGRHRRR